MGAVHRPEHQLLVLQLHGREHVVLEVGPVAGEFVEVALGEVRREDVLVARLALEVEDELLELAPDDRALGQPEREARADQLVRGEELQLPAQPPMVAPSFQKSARNIG